MNESVSDLIRAARAIAEDVSVGVATAHDPAIGRALALIHESPALPWTLAQLMRVAALSRSSFCERFVRFIGQPPMQYLANCRMLLATSWLRDTDAKVLQVALEVGYENESAFSRAFKRALGVSPSVWRRAHRTAGAVRAA